MERHKTISEIKLSFIREQIRILTSPLRPSSDWSDYGPEVEDDLPDKVVEDVLQKCTRKVPETSSFILGNWLNVSRLIGGQ
jgi:hypothetical protein